MMMMINFSWFFLIVYEALWGGLCSMELRMFCVIPLAVTGSGTDPDTASFPSLVLVNRAL